MTLFAKTVTQDQDHYHSITAAKNQLTELTQMKATHGGWENVPTSLASTSVLSKPVSSGGEERSEGVERSVTIIPHMGGQESRWEQEKCKKFDNPNRRRSIADYAFPELHPDTALRKSSRNLLIYTRTRCLELVHPFNIGQEVIQKKFAPRCLSTLMRSCQSSSTDSSGRRKSVAVPLLPSR